MTLKLSKAKFLLLGIILLELFLGGSGRMVELGPLTLRMYLFVLGLFVSGAILFYTRRIDVYVIAIILIFSISLVIATAVGFMNGASIELISLDLKPLLFFLFLITAYVFIDSVTAIFKVITLIKFSSLTLAIGYLTLLSMLYFGFIDFQKFWDATYDYNEFFFRGSRGFFTYKGFIYLGVGFIFWERLASKSLKKVFVLLLISIALILSGTRGFILGIGLIYFIQFVIPRLIKGRILYFIITAFFVGVFIYFMGSFDLGNKLESDGIRLLQLKEVLANFSIRTLLFGHGFGNGTEIRPIHMEVAYLEILHKQGLFGIFTWVLSIAYLTIIYKRVKRRVTIAQAFYLSSIFVFILSLTNPYINNPIGLTVIIISIVVLNILNKTDKDEDFSLHSNI